MKTNRTWPHRMLRTTVILACILLPALGIAADPSVNEQLLRAAEKGSLEQINTLLAEGADVNAKDNIGITVLVKAIRSRNLEAVKLLIDRGANVNVRSKTGDTALMDAAESTNLQIVRFFHPSRPRRQGQGQIRPDSPHARCLERKSRNR